MRHWQAEEKNFSQSKIWPGFTCTFCITAFAKENKNIKSKLHSQARTCCGYNLINFLLSSRVFSFSSLSCRASLSRPFFCWDPYLKQTNKQTNKTERVKEQKKKEKLKVSWHVFLLHWERPHMFQEDPICLKKWPIGSPYVALPEAFSSPYVEKAPYVANRIPICDPYVPHMWPIGFDCSSERRNMSKRETLFRRIEVFNELPQTETVFAERKKKGRSLNLEKIFIVVPRLSDDLLKLKKTVLQNIISAVVGVFS